jgi:hypothetical protein
MKHGGSLGGVTGTGFTASDRFIVDGTLSIHKGFFKESNKRCAVAFVEVVRTEAT